MRPQWRSVLKGLKNSHHNRKMYDEHLTAQCRCSQAACSIFVVAVPYEWRILEWTAAIYLFAQFVVKLGTKKLG